MSVTIRRQRDGNLRPYWYGEYRDQDGRRVAVNLGRWRGTPPPAWTGEGDKETGDAAFEKSRREAEGALKARQVQARQKGHSAYLIESLIEVKTGKAVEHTRIADLGDRWLSMPRDGEVTPVHAASVKAAFGRFRKFMRQRNPEAVYLYSVTPEDAGAFAESLRKGFAPRTAKGNVAIVRGAFRRFLPEGAANPFAGIVAKRKGKGQAAMIHRKPFTPDELQTLLNAVRGDALLHGLITAAACTGMRRGDVCRLRWGDVDFSAGMVTAKASKTDEAVEVPIFPPLRAVLEERRGNGSPFVFHEAAAMMDTNPGGLTWRFKKAVAAAFDTPSKAEPPTPAAEIEPAGRSAIEAEIPEGPRRTRMLDTLTRYCAGESFKAIAKATGFPKATISTDLHTVERWTGKRFLRVQAPDVKSAIARITRQARKKGKGQRAASVWDWHALRTTFVTLALSAGVPMELVRRVTGHQTVDVVLRNYFRPGREHFRDALAGALPAVLTGGKPAKLKPADELAALAGKVATGTATDEDKKRLRLLAVKV